MINEDSKDKLKDILLHNQCLVTRSGITLRSGIKTSVYFDCKRATLDGQFLDIVSDVFLDCLPLFAPTPTAVGGLTMGADFLTAAIILKSFQRHINLTRGSIARKEPKRHGTGVFVENELPVGTKIVLVDDVITSGTSILESVKHFKNSGYNIVGAFALIDRQLGGVEKIKLALNCPVIALFKQSELI